MKPSHLGIGIFQLSKGPHPNLCFVWQVWSSLTWCQRTSQAWPAEGMDRESLENGSVIVTRVLHFAPSSRRFRCSHGAQTMQITCPFTGVRMPHCQRSQRFQRHPWGSSAPWKEALHMAHPSAKRSLTKLCHWVTWTLLDFSWIWASNCFRRMEYEWPTRVALFTEQLISTTTTKNCQWNVDNPLFNEKSKKCECKWFPVLFCSASWQQAVVRQPSTPPYSLWHWWAVLRSSVLFSTGHLSTFKVPFPGEKNLK